MIGLFPGMNRTSRSFSAALLFFVCLMAGPTPGFAADAPDDTGPADTAPADAPASEAPAPTAPVPNGSPFKDLPGRWVGDGKIGLKDGKVETVKCRATYF